MRWKTGSGYVTLSGNWLINVSKSEGKPTRKRASAWRLKDLSHWLVSEGPSGWTLTLQWGVPVRWEVVMTFGTEAGAMGWVDEYVPDTDFAERSPSFRTVRAPDAG